MHCLGTIAADAVGAMHVMDWGYMWYIGAMICNAYGQYETMVCAVCFSVFLRICDMAGLLRGTSVSLWYLPRIWPSVTDMQHYYHARYPTDDWHLAYMFSLVYFFVEVCLVGMFPHYVSTRRDPCVRVYAPLTLPLLTRAKRGGIWTDVWVCLHYWVVIWVAG